MSGDAWKTNALTGLNGPVSSLHGQTVHNCSDDAFVLTVFIVRSAACGPLHACCAAVFLWPNQATVNCFTNFV